MNVLYLDATRGLYGASRMLLTLIQSLDRTRIHPYVVLSSDIDDGDMRLVELIMAGNQTRQHPRIGRVHFARDQGQTHAGKGSHAEHSQHGHVRVARADENHVLDDGIR